MKKWDHVVKFSQFWDRDIEVREKGELAAESLEFLKKYFKDDFDLDGIIEDFKAISGDGEPPETTEFTETEDFDARMYCLYDWADYNNVWIETMC